MFKLFAWHKVVQPDFYTHTVHEPFTNGAMEYGFVRKFADPLLLLTGTGYIPRQYWMVEQTPQVYANLAIPPVGVGHTYPVPTAIRFTELLNPDYTPVTSDQLPEE